ncbi:hypothetical protein [Bacillus safensis]|uniref:hypothetical protein n=1 Tax=Bacillus safensis TaxID=561879 RepID=UPI002452BFFB|nr:hypothetical protein [Bacillus safensis]MDH3095562.1 hypothetical protein [Bacillus safensis]
MVLKRVSNADGKGWLMVRFSDDKTYPQLPQFLHVENTKTEGGRDYFKIVEGNLKGKEASVKRKDNGSSYLDEDAPSLPAAQVHFVLDSGLLWYLDDNNKWVGPLTAITDSKDSVPVGEHDLEIPDEFHNLASSYEKFSPYACTWFRIGHSGPRYLHPGTHSLGCATVTDLSKWTDLYNYLIKRRKDELSVGTLKVFKTSADRGI